jgi:hypothetical protein
LALEWQKLDRSARAGPESRLEILAERDRFCAIATHFDQFIRFIYLYWRFSIANIDCMDGINVSVALSFNRALIAWILPISS